MTHDPLPAVQPPESATADPPASLAAARHRLIEACRHLAGAGLSPGGSGNISVRVGQTLLITPTGSSLRRVQPDELVVVDLDRPGPAPRTASKELPLHRAVHRVRSAAAVVHLHSPAAVAASCLLPPQDSSAATSTGPLPPLTPYQVTRLGTLPVAPFAAPGTAQLARAVESLASAHAVILLANHGSVVAADSLDAAVDLAEELEAAARLVLDLATLPHRTLTPAQVTELRAG